MLNQIKQKFISHSGYNNIMKFMSRLNSFIFSEDELGRQLILETHLEHSIQVHGNNFGLIVFYDGNKVGNMHHLMKISESNGLMYTHISTTPLAHMLFESHFKNNKEAPLRIFIDLSLHKENNKKIMHTAIQELLDRRYNYSKRYFIIFDDCIELFSDDTKNEYASLMSLVMRGRPYNVHAILTASNLKPYSGTLTNSIYANMSDRIMFGGYTERNKHFIKSFVTDLEQYEALGKLDGSSFLYWASMLYDECQLVRLKAK